MAGPFSFAIKSCTAFSSFLVILFVEHVSAAAAAAAAAAADKILSKQIAFCPAS